MRSRRLVITACCTLLSLSLAGASASAASAGGSSAPAPSGGARVGGLPPRAEARELSVAPRAVRAGARLPRVSVRIDQPGAARVAARLVVLRMPGGHPVARMDLGSVRTGRRVAAAWPRGLKLRAGRYVVRVHAKDGNGRVLVRRAATPGRTTLTVRPRPRPAAPAAPGPAPAAPTPAPRPAGDGSGVFPVAGPYVMAGPDGSFGAERGTHRHQGQDISAAEGVPVVSPVAGRVNTTSFQSGGAGYYVVVDGADGRSYFFAHCQANSFGARAGQAVAAGTRLCGVGSTGRSSGPHLHFEIWVPGWRTPGSAPIDPLPDLRAWGGR
jgi:murein DD-endopeptidase MepM/ murein hydrolase activator NlpD